jgi:hypothetical protein
MIAIGLLLIRMLCDYFRPRQQLEAELIVLRHQLNILQRQVARRPHLRWVDRALFIWLYRLPSHPSRHNHRQARDRCALASNGLCRLLAMEIPPTWGKTADC